MLPSPGLRVVVEGGNIGACDIHGADVCISSGSVGCVGAVVSRVRPKLGFGYGFGAEAAKFLGFGLVSVTAVTRILVSAWFRLRP